MLAGARSIPRPAPAIERSDRQAAVGWECFAEQVGRQYFGRVRIELVQRNHEHRLMPVSVTDGELRPTGDWPRDLDDLLNRDGG